jgi:hypothetical protein
MFAFSGCSREDKAKTEQLVKSADPVVENILDAVSQGSYEKFSKDLNSEMNSKLDEASFKQLNETVKTKIGSYVSKEFWKTQKNGNYTLLLYRAKFDKESSNVIVTVTLDPASQDISIAGFFLNSPNLQK